MLDLVNITIDHIEDWSSGSCVQAMHGPNDCYTDRFQLCAQHTLSTSEAWNFVHCNYKNLDLKEPPQPQPSLNETVAVMRECAQAVSASYDTLHECASGKESAEWAKASAARAAKDGPHPIWLFIDGTRVDGGCTPKSPPSCIPNWAAAVLKAICSATHHTPLPAACS